MFFVIDDDRVHRPIGTGVAPSDAAKIRAVLQQYLIGIQVGLSVDVRRNESLFECRCFQHGRLVDGDWSGIDRSRRCGGRASVGRITNRRPFGRDADFDLKRFGKETAID